MVLWLFFYLYGWSWFSVLVIVLMCNYLVGDCLVEYNDVWCFILWYPDPRNYILVWTGYWPLIVALELSEFDNGMLFCFMDMVALVFNFICSTICWCVLLTWFSLISTFIIWDLSMEMCDAYVMLILSCKCDIFSIRV